MEVFIFALTVLGIWLVVRVKHQQAEIETLKKQFAAISRPHQNTSSPETESPKAESRETSTNTQQAAKEAPRPVRSVTAKPAFTPPRAKPQLPVNRPAPISEPAAPGWFSTMIGKLREDWMLWTGAISVALAGIFIVSYAISSGLLGPNLQFALATLCGIVLHGGAEYLRRRDPENYQIFGGLAAGGSITLFASMLAGLYYFEVLSAGFTFVLLAIIAMGTMVLALRYGPLMAIIGMLGAYLVPVMVGDSGGKFHFALGYILIITSSSLWLLRHIYRPWLWQGIGAGALFWWWVALTRTDTNTLLPWYISLTLLAYTLIPVTATAAETRYRRHLLQLTAIFSSITFASVVLQGSMPPDWLSWVSVLIVAAIAARRYEGLKLMPWLISLALAVATQAYRYIENQALAATAEMAQFQVAMTVCAVFAGAWLWTRQRDSYLHSSLAILSPLLWLACGWLTFGAPETENSWAGWTLVMTGVYGVLSFLMLRSPSYQRLSLWAILGLHASYSLAAAIWLEEASLTAALSVQLISLTLLMRRYSVPSLGLLLKAVLAVVVLRLTLNPWLLTYDNSVHWSLWTYGGAFLSALIAARLTPESNPVRRWLEAASLHLFVLFAGAELRYYLYDGQVFTHEYGLTEAGLNSMLWGALALTYRVRARVSSSLAGWYNAMAYVLIGLALISYSTQLLWNNPLWSGDHFSTTPLFNLLTLVFAGPLLIALIFSRTTTDQERNFSRWLSVAMGAVLVLLSVRHFWQDGYLDLGQGIATGEWYSYSAAAILAAVIVITVSLWRGQASLYRYGSILMGLATVKIFLSDMSGLDGLWRAASFLGLGIALLGMTWLYRRTFGSGTVTADSEQTP